MLDRRRAPGYVGSRLVERLAVRGHAVVVLARHPKPNWPSNVDAVAVDVGDAEATAVALKGVMAAFYLVHALAEGEDFAERDRRLATSFAHAAQSTGVERFVYLGGLGREALSAHLASRQDVGVVLQESGIPMVGTVTRHDGDHLVLASTGWFFGEGWLGYRLTSSPPKIEQVAAFRPKGLPGLAYWRILWPIYFVVFRVMARGQVHRARVRADATTSGPPPSSWSALWARARHYTPVRADHR